MTELEQLLIERACERVVLLTAAHVDAGDAAALAAQFDDEAVLQRPSGEPLRGRAAIEAAYAQRDPLRITRHVVTNLRFEIRSPVAVRARSLVTLWAGLADAVAGARGRPADPPPVLGEFDDQLECRDGRWRIVHRTAGFLLHR